MGEGPTGGELATIHAYWRAANYLTVGQIYLQDNPLLREPLRPAHIKPRLLGHWGTSPGLSLVYVYLNRLIRQTDANCLLAVADHCLRSRNHVNLIDKQPQLQWLDMEAARRHCARGASVWSWASNDDGREPDVVLAAAGDVATLEVVAAAWLARRHAPELKVRVVNVVDLMTLFPPEVHPHGLDEQAFVDLFTEDKPVVFAFHGYQRLIHEIVHGRPWTERFHVRGFNEEGTTTTPFDMVVPNGMSSYHLCLEALQRVPRMTGRASALIRTCNEMLACHKSYIVEHLEDMPEVRDWVWS